MATVQDEVKCNQCGFPYAGRVRYPSHEWDIMCHRCGYYERWKHKSYFSNGHLEKGVHEFYYSTGAFYAKWANRKSANCGSLSETDIEKVAVKTRADIAAGRLSSESYVTRFDFKSRKLTAVVGRVPMHSPHEEVMFWEGTQGVDEQEDDDLSSEI